MAFTTPTLGLWRFNQTLYDSVANNNFVLNNEDPYSVGNTTVGLYSTFSRFNLFTNQYENVYGVSYSDGVSYEVDVSSFVNGSFTIGFWLQISSALGYVRHAVTREKTPKTAPVVAKAERSIVDNQELLEMANFVIIEQAASATTNRLVLMLSQDGVSIANSISSAPYSVGVHHFLITYDLDNSQARIDVDGSFGSWQTAPASTYHSISSVKLNAINPDYVSHQSNNRSTIIKDLYLQNEPSLDETAGIRNFTYGVDYVTDLSLSEIEFANFAFSFSQPNTIATNSILATGSNIYLGRSNGDILKGEQPIWDTDFTFDSNTKNNALQQSQAGAATYTDNGLVLNGSFIRI